MEVSSYSNATPDLAAVSATPWAAHGTGICAANAWLAKDLIGLGFKACTRDCAGAMVTDALLALHGFVTARRFWRHRARSASTSSRGSLDLGWFAASVVTTNAIWSTVGTAYWLQPEGVRGEWFDFTWRLNAYVQAVLYFFAWRLLLELLRVSAVGSETLRRGRLLKGIAVIHAIFFAVATSPLLPEGTFGEHCRFEHYVLWGASNILPPLGLTWVVLMTIAVSASQARTSAPARRNKSSHDPDCHSSSLARKLTVCPLLRTDRPLV